MFIAPQWVTSGITGSGNSASKVAEQVHRGLFRFAQDSPMKALSKRTKLLLLVGIPVALLLAALLYLGFHKDALQADYDRIQVGMTLTQVWEILPESDGTLCRWGSQRAKFGNGGLAQYFEFQQSDSFLFPGGRICGHYDFHQKVIDKKIHRPTLDEIWPFWKRWLGL